MATPKRTPPPSDVQDVFSIFSRRQSPKIRQASMKGKPETRRPPIPSALRIGSNPDDIPPSAVDRAYEAGRGNRLQFAEMLNAVKKLPPDLRKKLGKALRAGVKGKKNFSIYHL